MSTIRRRAIESETGDAFPYSDRRCGHTGGQMPVTSTRVCSLAIVIVLSFQRKGGWVVFNPSHVNKVLLVVAAWEIWGVFAWK